MIAFVFAWVVSGFMPPRKKVAKVEDCLTGQQLLDQNENTRLKSEACLKGLVSRHGQTPTVDLDIPPVLKKCQGKDIVKKSSTRKNRYLLLFNALIAPVKGGKVGTLAHLDTKNPVMYLDFPQGRLKFLGTLVFPKSKYLMLKLGRADHVLCEDVFENMIVFSECFWVGSKEENPEEAALPLPEVIKKGLHEPGSYHFDDGGNAAGAAATPSAGRKRPLSTAAALASAHTPIQVSPRINGTVARRSAGQLDHQESDSDGGEGSDGAIEVEGDLDGGPPSTGRALSSRRTKKPRSYCESPPVDEEQQGEDDDDDDDDVIEGEEGKENPGKECSKDDIDVVELVVRKTPKGPAQRPRKIRKLDIDPVPLPVGQADTGKPACVANKDRAPPSTATDPGPGRPHKQVSILAMMRRGGRAREGAKEGQQPQGDLAQHEVPVIALDDDDQDDHKATLAPAAGRSKGRPPSSTNTIKRRDQGKIQKKSGQAAEPRRGNGRKEDQTVVVLDDDDDDKDDDDVSEDDISEEDSDYAL